MAFRSFPRLSACLASANVQKPIQAAMLARIRSGAVSGSAMAGSMVDNANHTAASLGESPRITVVCPFGRGLRGLLVSSRL